MYIMVNKVIVNFSNAANSFELLKITNVFGFYLTEFNGDF